MHTPEQLHAALEALRGIGKRYAVPIMLDAYSGFRWSELVALKDDDLDTRARRVRVDERVTLTRRLVGRCLASLPRH